MKVSQLCLILLPVAHAFTTPVLTTRGVSSGVGKIATSSSIFSSIQDEDNECKPIVEENVKDATAINSISAVSATLCLLSSEVANAAGPDWGKIFPILLVSYSKLEGASLRIFSSTANPSFCRNRYENNIVQAFSKERLALFCTQQ